MITRPEPIVKKTCINPPEWEYGECFYCKGKMYDEPRVLMMNKDVGIMNAGYAQFEIHCHHTCGEVVLLNQQISKAQQKSFIDGRESMYTEVKLRMADFLNDAILGSITINDPDPRVYDVLSKIKGE